MHNGTLLPRRGARRAAVTALAASLAIALMGAGSGCSVDLLDPNAFNLFKQAIATSTPSAPGPVAAATPGRVWNGRGSETAGTPVVDAHSETNGTPVVDAHTDQPPLTPAVAPVAMDPPIPISTEPALDRVVASVDGEPITMHEVKDFAAQHGRPITSDDFASSQTAKDTVKALIGEKLLEQEVKKYEDKIDEGQVDKYIQELRQDKHLTDAQFREQLQASGMSYDELRKRARLDLEKAMMIQQEVREKIEIPDSEIQAAYDSHKADFTVAKERLKLAQILIAIPPNASPQQIAEAQKKADTVRARAAKGNDFNDLARTYSDDDSKSNGGELGWFEPSDVMDQILASVKTLKPGQISPVIRSSHGFHVVKLEDHEVPGVRPLSEVKTQIRAALVDQQSSGQLETWIESDLVKQHYVETMY
jgi:parvulin-like peptidyl-prolyl isomerase